MKETDDFISAIQQSIDGKQFVKITLSKPSAQSAALVNVYIRLIKQKQEEKLSFTYHYKTKDETKNFDVEGALQELRLLIPKMFYNSRLFTLAEDRVLQITKKGNAVVTKLNPSISEAPSLTHDRKKTTRTNTTDSYLVALGIMDSNGTLIPKMADKYRQINKYLEIIESLIKSTTLPEQINIVDMGSGKGYLTFALYDFLKNKQDLNVTVSGIELRPELVDQCNNIARACGFAELKFLCEPIEKFDNKKIDILIALHACDTATDDAIAKGILADASLIVCAPCCHKQIRQQVKGKEQENPLMKYGIFKERQFEMITDTIRALILEKKHYQTNIFEFVSNEHTRKNILLVGTKTDRSIDETSVDKKINSIKESYQIEYHYLEKIMG